MAKAKKKRRASGGTRRPAAATRGPAAAPGRATPAT
ncbi:MAG: hypothetical protein QOK43_646, partial [Acidimicrobiaceae bacterium]|nr:hypothetical protein [Acidimicrobiaceae bacterium]